MYQKTIKTNEPPLNFIYSKCFERKQSVVTFTFITNDCFEYVRPSLTFQPIFIVLCGLLLLKCYSIIIKLNLRDIKSTETAEQLDQHI